MSGATVLVDDVSLTCHCGDDVSGPHLLRPGLLQSLKAPFPTPFEGDPNHDYDHEGDSAALQVKYLKELELCAMLGQLREKPEWWLKVQQPIIVNRWKKEMYKQATLLTPQAIEYGIQELKYQSQLYQQTSMRGHSILLSAIDGVYQNDQFISPELLQQLKECLKPFEDVPDSERDYHPGSDHQVIDLVHPSLYCLRIGQTKLTKEPIPLKDALRSIGSGEVVSEPPFDLSVRYATSKKYAWLPTEFEVSSDGSKVKINSYINNIYPIEHAKLYGVLESIFASFIPMFERVLTDLQSTPPSRMRVSRWDEPIIPGLIESYLAQEREAFKLAAGSSDVDGEQRFYLDDAGLKDAADQMSLRYEESARVLSQIHPDIALSKSSDCRSIVNQFQDRLARLFLESTFEACTKTKGFLTNSYAITPTTDFSHPPFLNIYAPPSVLAQFPQLLKHSLKEMIQAGNRALNQRKEGVYGEISVFSQKMARRWIRLFKERLPQLYPQLDLTIRQQYLDALFKKEYFNSYRLAGYLHAELMELSGKVAKRQDLIGATHLQLAIANDAELAALDAFLKQRYPDVDAVVPQPHVVHDPTPSMNEKGDPQPEAQLPSKSEVMNVSKHLVSLKLSKSAELCLIQFQDRLARLYLESTFEAYSKTEGLLTTAHTIQPGTDFTQPPFIGLYLPQAVLTSLGELLKHSRTEMSKAVSNTITDSNADGGRIMGSMAQRWLELFQRRLPLLYPQMEAHTRDQYCQLFLTKDYANLIRLCGAIEYFTVEILELGDKVARGLGVETIELEHINSAIKNDDAELNALDTYLNHLYGSNDSTVTDADVVNDETNEAELAAALMKLMNSSTAARLKEVEEDKRAINFHDDEEEEEEEAEEDEHRHKVDQPEVIWPFTPETRTPNSTISLAGRALQVIVKLANIELTPEKPNYPGGAWHVEGMKNEAIVASGIYYINSTNITESRLSFRQSVDYSDEMVPEQDDSATPFSLYGLERDGDMNQELGSLITKSGRAIAFPNIYQHQVQPFQLA